MANQIVLDKVKATAHFFDAVAPAGLENGNMVTIGVRGTDATRTVAAPGAVTDLGMAIVCAVPLSYQAERTENDFVIGTGDVVRVRIPELGDVESYPVANFLATQAAAVGVFVVPDVGLLPMEMVAAAGGTESIVYIIDRLYTKAGVAMLQMRCIKSN